MTRSLLGSIFYSIAGGAGAACGYGAVKIASEKNSLNEADFGDEISNILIPCFAFVIAAIPPATCAMIAFTERENLKARDTMINAFWASVFGVIIGGVVTRKIEFKDPPAADPQAAAAELI